MIQKSEFAKKDAEAMGLNLDKLRGVEWCLVLINLIVHIGGPFHENLGD